MINSFSRVSYISSVWGMYTLVRLCRLLFSITNHFLADDFIENSTRQTDGVVVVPSACFFSPVIGLSISPARNQQYRMYGLSFDCCNSNVLLYIFVLIIDLGAPHDNELNRLACQVSSPWAEMCPWFTLEYLPSRYRRTNLSGKSPMSNVVKSRAMSIRNMRTS